MVSQDARASGLVVVALPAQRQGQGGRGGHYPHHAQLPQKAPRGQSEPGGLLPVQRPVRRENVGRTAGTAVPQRSRGLEFPLPRPWRPALIHGRRRHGATANWAV